MYLMSTQKAIDTLKQWMGEKEVTPTQLAKRSGVSKSTISLLFSGQRSASVEVLGNLAEALGHPRSEIFEIAGVLPTSKDDPWVIEMKHKLEQLNPELRSVAEDIIEAIYKNEQKGKRRSK